MKLERITSWLSRTLNCAAFDDVSNNGLQIAREGDEIKAVAFGVDASVAFLEEAAAAGAQLAVVHHGISWGGGIRRLTGSEYAVVKTAMKHNLALYAVHLPLDANPKVGNNWELARSFGAVKIEPAFSYHGNIIGVIAQLKDGRRIGVCSGGAGEFAVEAKERGCDLYLTGEASWGDQIAAQNVSMKMILAGHYETETYGIAALAKVMSRALRVKVVCAPKPPKISLDA